MHDMPQGDDIALVVIKVTDELPVLSYPQL